MEEARYSRSLFGLSHKLDAKPQTDKEAKQQTVAYQTVRG
jgi:hypothetical protein